MEVKKVTVVGSGLMGHSIAEVFALKNFSVTLYDIYDEALKKAREEIEKSLVKLVKSGKLKEDEAHSILGSMTFSSDIAGSLKDSDLIIEAVPESVELKHTVIKDIEKHCRPDAVIASNTSNIRISELASVSMRPEKLVGMHFFNPPVIMKLVEVVKGEKTSTDTFDSVVQITEKIGKTPVRVMKDTPGFVVNRISAPEGLFFCLLLDREIAKPEEVDTFAKSQGLPMGPYELMDFVGIDTVVHSLNYYSSELSPDYGTCKTFPKMVQEKLLGRKTGQGFYLWESGRAKMPEAKPSTALELMDVLALEVNEAVKLIEDGVAIPEDIETGVRLGMNRPFGPISVAQGLTNREIKAKLDSLYDKFQISVFKPAKSIEEGLLKEAISGNLKSTGKEERKDVPEVAKAEGGKYVKVTKNGFVATVSLTNGRLNLLSSGVIDDLDNAFTELSKDPETRTVIIRGAGDNFSAGAELSQFVNSPVDFMEMARHGQRVFKKLSELPQITIAMIKGYAFGGGMELSLAADLRYSTPDAQFGQTEVLRGLVPGWGGSQRLTRLAGFSRAAHLVLTGAKITGKEAKDYGIVLENYESERIDEEVMKLAENISQVVSPSAARVAKMLLYKGSEIALDDGLDLEAMAMGLLYGTDDLKEGISAFLQKRKPEFKGH